MEAGVRLNIVATARLVVEEMWTLSEMKLIQRTILSGKMEMQYTTEYLEDTKRISITLQQVDDQVYTYASITKDWRLIALSSGSVLDLAFWNLNFHQARSSNWRLPRLHR